MGILLRISCVGSALVLVLTSSLVAKVEVGDRPAFRAKTLDGRGFTHQDLTGRIVILEFWATWCGPCVAQVPHIKALHKEYAPKGVALIGLSLDDDARTVRTFSNKQGMSWPQVLDKQQAPRLASVFGVSGIPHAIIISPDGEVLWRGHPASIDEPLADAYRRHPPTRRNSAALEVAEKTENEKTNDGLEPKDRVAKAAPKAENLPVLERRAGNYLRIAERRRTAGKHVDAYATYRKITDRYEGTAAAVTAAEHCEAYESDEKLMAQYDRSIAERKAKASMLLAAAYDKQGKRDLSLLQCQEIISRYPGTKGADQAQLILTRAD